MKLVLYNCAALTNFDRFWFAVNGESGNQSPCSMGVVPSKQKSVLPRIPLIRRSNNVQTTGAFSMGAALRAIPMRASWRHGRTGERNHASAGWGRCTVSQDRQDVGVKGLNHAVNGSHVRAVADADSSEPTKKLHEGTAKETVCW